MRNAGAGALALVLIGFLFFTAPPLRFAPATITIEPGTSARVAAEALAEEGVVANALSLRLLLRLSGSHASVQSGTYYFEKPQGLLQIVHRLETGDTQAPQVRITFPEGFTIRQMGERVVLALPHITAPQFEAAAAGEEGYLFPDTYHFDPASSAEAVRERMRANFDTKLEPLAADIAASGRTLEEILIMASLVEKEARTVENKRLVAGVLWNRLERDMPLQTDAVFGYIFKRDTYHPSLADLQVDSPYNTYKYYGLPPGPINNPGLESIKAALYPAETDYLYYLTGSDDLMHYARTYAEHQANLRQYLQN